MSRTAFLLVSLLATSITGQAADKSSEGPVKLEQKLLGVWQGGACQGNWIFGMDGAFELRHYTPGNNTLTGNWQVRWNALPPTLVLTVKTSDAPDRIKVGEPWEVKLVQLNDETFAFEWPQNPGQPVTWTRMKK